MPVEQFIFVRHGETDMNRELRCQGRVNIALNALGQAQAAETAERLAGVRVDRIFVSPLVPAAFCRDGLSGISGETSSSMDNILPSC